MWVGPQKPSKASKVTGKSVECWAQLSGSIAGGVVDVSVS